MSKRPPPPRNRHLSNEDEALWEHTASTLKPIRAKRQRHGVGRADVDLDAVPPFAPAAKPKKPGSSAAAATHAKPPPPASPQPVGPPALNQFDRKSARKLRQGQIEIDARIDLHGMRQHEAHVALRRFLLSAFARGLRWVLVITGKGGPQRTRDEDGYGAPERGILRRNVPMWLAEPELRKVVVSFTTAAISHGGEGALYVQLRNPDRARS